MYQQTLAQLAQGLKKQQFSSVELTTSYLNRIKQLDPQLNSFISVAADSALAAAQQADQQRAAGDDRPLLGIPCAHKDIFCTQGVKTSCASKMLDNFTAPYDATVVSKLKQAGLVMLGKTNMDEFAMGSSNETSFYGPVKNPWDLTTVAGGSSGGSAAAVAARLIPAATGTDTGGSIRQPAALTGTTGLKPSYGRVSRWGMIAFASSLDQAGPITQTAEDAALLLEAMAGFDPYDSTSMEQPVPSYSQQLNSPLAGLRIGLPKEFFTDEIESATAQAIQAAISEFTKLGATLVDVSLPHMSLAIPVYYVVAVAECSSNLSRYDGVRYGYRCDQPKDLLDLYQRSRSEGFGAEVKRRIMLGTYALSAGYYDAYYLQAQKVRRLIQQDFNQAFKQVDLLLGPTTPTPAFKLGAKTQDPIAMYLSDIYTVAVNLAGLPAISIPAGFSGGLPVGLQLIGAAFDEGRLLNAAHQYQSVTDWHSQLPKQEV
jgi:aspartyl-tRNA(Asn)/glutamyl-tRNA(Gln) amidotransferase subunit A